MKDFETAFLHHYLQFGLGSMPKSDVDALVMHLLDTHGHEGSAPLAQYSNQAVSELLRTPVAKVKRLRYEAALKFGGRVEDQAKARLLRALSQASLELDANKVCLIIEDTLAKNWLQGQLKNNQLIFEHSFNTEILKVDAQGLLHVLAAFFDAQAIAAFEEAFEQLKAKDDAENMLEGFHTIIKAFAEEAAAKAGGSVLSIFSSLI